MYNIREAQIKYAIKRRPSRLNMLKMIKDSGIELTKEEKENMLIFGSIISPEELEEFSDYEILKEFLGIEFSDKVIFEDLKDEMESSDI